MENFESGLVRISISDTSRFFFSIENLKSGLVQISILDFRFYPQWVETENKANLASTGCGAKVEVEAELELGKKCIS